MSRAANTSAPGKYLSEAHSACPLKPLRATANTLEALAGRSGAANNLCIVLLWVSLKVQAFGKGSGALCQYVQLEGSETLSRAALQIRQASVEGTSDVYFAL